MRNEQNISDLIDFTRENYKTEKWTFINNKDIVSR